MTEHPARSAQTQELKSSLCGTIARAASVFGVDEIVVYADGQAYTLAFAPPLPGAGAGPAADGKLLAPMPGRVVQLAAEPGAKVAKGEVVVTLEAMKMEHGLAAPFDAVVAEVAAVVGDQVTEGTLLVRLERAGEGA